MPKIGLHQLAQSAATNGQAPLWSDSAGEYVPGDVSGGGGAALGWFNVKDPAYGATGDGTTDDTAAVNAAIAALNTAGRGVLYFPAGTYLCTAELTTITAHAYIFGDGAGDLEAQNAATTLFFDSATGYLMTLAGDGTTVERLAFENPTTTTQTAGAAIRVTQGDLNRYKNVSVRGFYDCIDIEDGALWTMQDCYLVGPLRYGLYIRHIDLPDGGDMTVSGCAFYAEDRGAVAGVRMESGGGLKFIGNKINTLYGTGYFTYGLDVEIGAVTGVLNVVGNSIENVSSNSIRGRSTGGGSFQAATITSNEFGYYGAITSAAVDIDGWKDVTVNSNTGLAQSGGSTQPMIALANITNGAVGLNTHEGFTGGEYALTSCTNVTTVPTGGSLEVQDEGTTVESAATSLNFVGSSVDATTDGAGHVTVTVTTPSTSSGEVLMQDGVTSPPIPIETEAGDDWLYQG